jgi:hypothetical protein
VIAEPRPVRPPPDQVTSDDLFVPVPQTRTPVLITNDADRSGALRVTSDASTMVVELTVRGRWSPELGRQVTAALHQCLAGPTMSIIVDLHGLADPHGASQPFWLAAGQAARQDPRPARLALCLPSGTMLDFRLRHAAGSGSSMFAAMPEARAAVAGQLPRSERVQARLEPQPASVRAARALVIQACDAWRLPQLRDDAALIVSEFASNAVTHAGTAFVVTVSRRGSAVHLAVQDGARHYPRMGELVITSGERGRGLLLVDVASAAWGALPARDGKVVWATVAAS